MFNFFSPLEQFDLISVISLPLFFDLSFVNILLPLLLSFVFLFFFRIFSGFFKLVPGSWQFLFEVIFKFVLDIIKQQVGVVGFIYFPFIFTLFFFVLFCNLISLTPFGVALTSHVILIFFLSFTICFSIFLIGILNYGVHFFSIFVPKVPFVLLFLLIPIEIFSYFIRCLSLAIRLSANIMAGHTLVFIVSTFLLTIGSVSTLLFFFFSIFLLFILILEFGVAFLQAYVFMILICIYLNDSLNLIEH